MKTRNVGELLTENQQLIINNVDPRLLLLIEMEEVNSDSDSSPQEEQQASQDQQDAQDQQDQQDQAQYIPSPEELRQMEILGAEQKFTQGILYDSLSELSTKIDLLLDILYNNNFKFKDNFIRDLENYKQYIEVLNELIFSLSVDTTYKLVSQIKINIIELLDEFKTQNQDKFEDLEKQEELTNTFNSMNI